MSKFFNDMRIALLDAIKFEKGKRHKARSKLKISSKSSSWDDLEKELFTQEEIKESNKRVQKMLNELNK